MTANRVAVVVLILLAVLFSAGLVLGGRQPSGARASVTPPALMESVDRLLNQPATLDDIANASPATCRQEKRFVVPPGGTCSLTVGPLAAPLPKVRKLAFRLVAGGQATISVQLNEALTADKSVAAGGTSEPIDVYKDGARAQLTCVGLAACVLEMP